MSFFRGLFIALLIEAIAVLLIAAACTARADNTGPIKVRIPACQEDERYLKGKGDFYRDPVSGESRWTRYVCINQDNFGG